MSVNFLTKISAYTNLWIIVVLFLTLKEEVKGQSEEARVECIDNYSDFGFHKWYLSPAEYFQYAETSLDLPDPLKGNLTGDGIFYFKDHWTTQYIWKPVKDTDTSIRPIYFYAKYYHVSPSNTTWSVFMRPVPGDSGWNSAKFPPSHDFVWAEEFVEIDADHVTESVWDTSVTLGSSQPYMGEIFLFDKIILAQGHHVQDLNDIKRLCGWGEEEDTTTTSFEVPTTPSLPISTTPSSGFTCVSSGYFADPDDCAKFHVCEEDDNGGFAHSVFTCPAKTVWCQESLECEFPTVCPCP